MEANSCNFAESKTIDQHLIEYVDETMQQ